MESFSVLLGKGGWCWEVEEDGTICSVGPEELLRVSTKRLPRNWSNTEVTVVYLWTCGELRSALYC